MVFVVVVVVVVLVTVVEAAFEMKWIDATCSSLKWPPVFNVSISSRRLPAFGSRSGNRNIPWSRLSWCARMCWRCWKTSLSFNVFRLWTKVPNCLKGRISKAFTMLPTRFKMFLDLKMFRDSVEICCTVPGQGRLGPAVQQDLSTTWWRWNCGILVERLGHPTTHDAGNLKAKRMVGDNG